MSRGGARKGAGRKRGIGMANDIKKHCQAFIEEILKDEAIRAKATKQLSLSLEQNEDDYLYIIKVDDSYKIGYSSNWAKRLKNYRTHSPTFDITYLIKHEEAFELETELHNMFRDKRISGEWFDLNEKDIVKAVSYCSKRIS